LPFFLGLLTLLGMLTIKYAGWIRGFSSEEKDLMRKGIFSNRSLAALKEVFMESLLHRKMFKRNVLLGYMHMSFAFGWFLLILIGNIESRIYSKVHLNPPYYPIFLKYFVHDKRILTFELTSVPGIFRFLMDLILFMILSGLILALIKRFQSNWFGLKKTTRHTVSDRLAITALWLIFPLRLLAESFTAGQYLGGGFMTNNLGRLFANFLPVEHLSYPAWWAYSIMLCLFFITLPYSRFMHIPTEVLLIFLRHWGITPKNEFNNYSEIEIYSCPRCGICLDACPVYIIKHNSTPPVYFLRTIRNKNVEEKVAYDCLLCGRCQEYCPVGINNNTLRISQRTAYFSNSNGSFGYLPQPLSHKADVSYFAGCMTHLTPSIKISMERIFTEAGINYNFLDADGSICCGRPLMMAGKGKQARLLMEHNRKLIAGSSCKTLVTSCPICLKVFKEEYRLDIEVLHHTQFLLNLIKERKLNVSRSHERVVYHDPCELGRGSGIYEEPRVLINRVAELVESANERADSLCCSGSLGNTEISSDERDQIKNLTLASLLKNQPELIITACPLCKKTLQKGVEIGVMDISEIIARSVYKKESVRVTSGLLSSLETVR
jgi:Fe-S oxidoreductase